MYSRQNIQVFTNSAIFYRTYSELSYNLHGIDTTYWTVSVSGSEAQLPHPGFHANKVTEWYETTISVYFNKAWNIV